MADHLGLHGFTVTACANGAAMDRGAAHRAGAGGGAARHRAARVVDLAQVVDGDARHGPGEVAPLPLSGDLLHQLGATGLAEGAGGAVVDVAVVAGVGDAELLLRPEGEVGLGGQCRAAHANAP
ncbi:MAG: hypothetical protein K2X49_29080 [Acetobacteraceae bacterium]|nr:hypothetical protein [Acetobacteraceae bacterium]